ncbi:MAG: hypothetical protein KGQ59_03495 [Bdellovibrionales bacterium]|nr:hypothetical protein [Bdellovibrionales bacterium]
MMSNRLSLIKTFLFFVLFLAKSAAFAGELEKLSKEEIQSMPQARLEELYLKDECSGPNCELMDFKNVEELKKETKLTEAQLKAIYEYTFGKFDELNKKLGTMESGSTLTNSQQAFVRVLDCALDRLPPLSPTVVYRGTSRRIPMKKGAIVHFEPYTSTSQDREQAEGFIRPGGRLLILKVRSGRDVAKIARDPREKEVLLPRKMKFRVESLKKEKMQLLDEEAQEMKTQMVEVVTLSELD